MENASKALIIAGSILIAIMIISLSVLMFSKFSGAAKEAVNMDEQEIASFNSKLTPYMGNGKTGAEVNSLLQYCLTVNTAAKKSGETQKYITVSYPVGTSTVPFNQDSTSYTRVESGTKRYNVTGSYNDNGLLTTITVQ